jgi:hypothetical protein
MQARLLDKIEANLVESRIGRPWGEQTRAVACALGASV